MLAPQRSIFATTGSKSNETATDILPDMPHFYCRAGNVRRNSFDARKTGLPLGLVDPLTFELERQPQSKLHEARIASQRCDRADATIRQC